MKPRLNIAQQIEKIKDKGITFNKGYSKDKAKEFLEKNTFYYKLLAYKKNYKRDKNNKFIDLDFSYLVELSVIDMRLIYRVSNFCSAIEHTLKTKLIRDFLRSNVDEYSIVQEFFKDKGSYAFKRLEGTINQTKNKKNLQVYHEILFKYGTDKLAIWHLVEIITFGELIALTELFYGKYRNKIFESCKNLLFSINKLRNRAAHNNCLINNLNYDDIDHLIEPTKQLIDFLYDEVRVDHGFSTKLLTVPFLNNLIAGMYVLDKIGESDLVKYHEYRELRENVILAKRREEFFKFNVYLVDSYCIIIRVIEYFFMKYNKIINY